MVAQQASKTVVENAAKITGSITIVLGLAFIVWDAVQIAQKATEASLGDALRDLADQLECKDLSEVSTK